MENEFRTMLAKEQAMEQMSMATAIKVCTYEDLKAKIDRLPQQAKADLGDDLDTEVLTPFNLSTLHEALDLTLEVLMLFPELDGDALYTAVDAHMISKGYVLPVVSS